MTKTHEEKWMSTIKIVSAVLSILIVLSAIATGISLYYTAPVQANMDILKDSVRQHQENENLHPSREYLEEKFKNILEKIEDIKEDIKRLR